MSADAWTITASNGAQRKAQSRSDAEKIKADMEDLGLDCEIESPGESASGGTKQAPLVAQVGKDVPDQDDVSAASTELETLAASVRHDPLDILPDYMIDRVKGTPTLNKRGLSVLAFHYGISIVDREVRVSPHESNWEYAIVETTVENGDGNTFVGTGTAHVDRGDDRDVLMELAETRSYKRAVSFATGTGIVSYQEMVNDLE